MRVFPIVVLFVLVACSPEEARRKAAGNVLFKRGDFAGAEREYRAAAAKNPNDPNAHTLLGNAQFELERYDAAKASYEAACALDPKARAALQGLAVLHLRQKRPADAKAALERMLANEPRDAEAHTALGKILYGEKRWDGAERHLREALVHVQNEPSALYTLGLVFAKRKERDQAYAIFDRLDRITPDKAYAPYGKAVAAAEAGNTEEALKWLAVALERGIEDPGQIESDESFAALKGAPKFAELIAAARSRAPPKKGGP